VRPAGDEAGYMRWSELRDLDRAGFEIEPHGVDHARVPTSDAVVGTLDAHNWRRNAWMQWRATPGPKHDWFRMETPVAVPLGSAIPASGLALAERAWIDGAREAPAMFATRIEHDLERCREAFVDHLGRVPRIFCWPENKTCAEARQIARRIGYHATTGGKGRNATHEPADVLSRIHVDDRAIGIRWLAIEGLYLRAAVRLMQGNHYWYLLLAPMHIARRMIFAVRRRFGDGFA